MKTATQSTLLGLVGVMAMSLIAPAFADGNSTQKNKNDWRNYTGAGAAVLGYGLLTHNGTATLLGAAGTAYSANRYEQERRSQSRQRDAERQRYYRRSHRHYYYDHNGVKHYRSY
jgi:hypothetical protein